MARAWRTLRITWWPVFASFAVVVAAFTRDRVCYGGAHLLAGVDQQVTLAWAVAIAYVLGHAWLVAVYTCAVVGTGEVIPGRRSTTLGVAFWQFVLMLLVVFVEYAPAVLWRAMARTAGWCGL